MLAEVLRAGAGPARFPRRRRTPGALARAWLRVFEGAVPIEVCEQVKADLAAAFEHGDDRLLFAPPLVSTSVNRLEAGHRHAWHAGQRHLRVLRVARAVRSSRADLHFLGLIFDAATDAAPEPHVRLREPPGLPPRYCVRGRRPAAALAASWIALKTSTRVRGAHLLRGQPRSRACCSTASTRAGTRA